MGWIFSIVMLGLKRRLRRGSQDFRPVLIEAVTERFRGHSISDPGLYRTKEELAANDGKRSDHPS